MAQARPDPSFEEVRPISRRVLLHPARGRPEGRLTPMLARIFAFEIRYQLRQPLFWFAAALFFLLTFAR